MGSPPAEAGRSNDEGPQTDVTISHGFWLGVFPVTQEERKPLADEVSELNSGPSFFRGSGLPVEQVSWNDCQAWLRELNGVEEGRLPQVVQAAAHYEYRLPTEAECEFACRAGTATRFHCGDPDETLDQVAWFSANAGGQPRPVGEKMPNGWGLHDMHGSVWEWCNDWYGPLTGRNMRDPRGPVLGLKRVMRGGSWGVAASRCRSAYRVWNEPGYRDYTVGFRLALAPAI